MSTNELIHFIQKNPSILKRPIMIDERRFQVGYNAEEIRAFIPRELRKLAECQKFDNCPQFSASTLVEDYHHNKKQAYRPVFNVLKTLAILLAQFPLYCR